MSSDLLLHRSLQLFAFEKHRKPLGQCRRADLPFWNDDFPVPSTLLLDTTVYIDQLRGKFPAGLDSAVLTASLFHSPVTEAELAALPGILDPTSPGTPAIIAQVARSIEERSPFRILTPDREVWREAGILAGLLARLQQYGKADQRRALNDALLLSTAVKHGCTVLTRNWRDFDLLLQLDARGQALFYDVVPVEGSAVPA